MHVIVQAGGRGSRLRHHTWNKPKCLVSIRGKPLLYHLFDRFPSSCFHIIGDYAYDQLENYLKVNPPGVEYNLTHAMGKGTATGIADALLTIPADQELILTWSDLIIGDLPAWPITELPVVCTTNAFTCRWTLQDTGILQETPGANGIPGLFYFPRADAFPIPPAEGEFVKWFSKQVSQFNTLLCNDLEELGDFTSIEHNNDSQGFSRFFNRVDINNETVVKQAIDLGYKHLIDKEQHWYKTVRELGFRRIPQVISTDPFIMSRIHGEHAYQMKNLNEREQRSVLADYIDSLMTLHNLGSLPTNVDSVTDTYLTKTCNRVNSVSKLIPGFSSKAMTVNGKKVKNFFHDSYQGDLEQLLPYLWPTKFTPIHGDPTFSNSLIDHNLKVWFIDPRGYFGQPGIWGDPWYDFAKVYYSAVGGYDAFNRRKFKLHVDSETVEVIAEEPAFAHVGQEIFTEFFGNDLARIEILHGLIWLALSGYARDDIDSVIGSFYLGLYWLERGIEKL